MSKRQEKEVYKLQLYKLKVKKKKEKKKFFLLFALFLFFWGVVLFPSLSDTKLQSSGKKAYTVYKQ